MIYNHHIQPEANIVVLLAYSLKYSEINLTIILFLVCDLYLQLRVIQIASDRIPKNKDTPKSDCPIKNKGLGAFHYLKSFTLTLTFPMQRKEVIMI